MKSPGSTPNKAVRWYGDLADDCTARWAGLTLRAEKMADGEWWWCVYDEESEGQVASSNGVHGRVRTGGEARHAAEQAARSYLNLKDRRRHWHPRKKSTRGKKPSVDLWKRASFSSAKPLPKRRRHRS